MRRHVAAISLLLGFVAVCYLVRSLVQTGMAVGEEIPVIPGLFSLRYVRKPGAAFVLFAGTSADFRFPFLMGAGVVALIVLTRMYFRAVGEGRLEPCGLATLLGGATANLLERAVAGDVVDYLDFFLGHTTGRRSTWQMWPSTSASACCLWMRGNDGAGGRQTMSGLLPHSMRMKWWRIRSERARLTTALFGLAALPVEGCESASNPFALSQKGSVPHRDEWAHGLRDHCIAPRVSCAEVKGRILLRPDG